MAIVIERTLDTKKWDRSVVRAGGSPFLGTGFLGSFEKDLLEPIYLDFREDGDWIGGISGLIVHPSVKIVRKVNSFNSLIFYTGPLLLDRSRETEAMNALVRWIVKDGHVSFIMTEYDHPYDYKGMDGSFRIGHNPEFHVSLEGGWDEVRGRLKERIRDKCSKAKKNGLSFGTDRSREGVDTLGSLIEETGRSRQERGYTGFNLDPIPYFSRDVMKNMLERGAGRLAYVTDGTEILSSQFFISLGDKSYAVLMGTNDRGYAKGANAYLLVNIMELLHGEGISLYNLGGNPKDGYAGVEFYKLGFGARKIDSTSIVSPFLQDRIHRWISMAYRTVKEVRSS